MKEPAGCCCRRPDARECMRIRYQVWRPELDETCECPCHSKDEDGFTDWDDDEDRAKGPWLESWEMRL